jgi:hypothetical protein
MKERESKPTVTCNDLCLRKSLYSQQHVTLNKTLKISLDFISYYFDVKSKVVKLAKRADSSACDNRFLVVD